jgi:hypothetical protein
VSILLVEQNARAALQVADYGYVLETGEDRAAGPGAIRHPGTGGRPARDRCHLPRKGLIAAAYGKGPDRSYIGGCSNGGRHAMVAAARLGDQYDGYLVGAPGYRLPNAALAQLWGAQQWATVSTPGATIPHPMNPSATLADLGSGFTPKERQLLSSAVLEQCDALDGARDGMVQATQACQARFNLQKDVPTCQGERNGQCLTVAQKQVVAAVFSGAKTATGQPIYASFPYDTGVSGANWATWKFVNALALDPLAVGAVFSVPPGRVDPLKEDVEHALAPVQRHR